MVYVFCFDFCNVVIVVYVDYGKIIFVDVMFCQMGFFGEYLYVEECVMDLNDFECEKGIMIFVKNMVIIYKGKYVDGKEIMINVIDIFGYVDFGGEVECGLLMVDGVVFFVDVSEGLLLQICFVLCKVFEVKFFVIFLVNKIDCFDVCIVEVEEEVYDLLLGFVFDLVDDVLDFDVDVLFDVLVVYVFGCVGVVLWNCFVDGVLFDNDDFEFLFEVIFEYVFVLVYDDEVLLQVWVMNFDFSLFFG